MNGGRFAVSATWKDFDGKRGKAKAASKLGDSGTFFFFAKENWEMVVKVLDGCEANNRYWVFAAATTNLEHTLRVRDTVSGKVKSYRNRLGHTPDIVTDSAAFASCP